MIITEFAAAKINLALHITGQRADGYHLLDTLVTFADVGDRLTFEDAPGLSLDVTGPEGQALSSENDNLVLRASEALQRWASSKGQQTSGAHINLEKNLPISSGIGGGSADAAAAVRGLIKLWQLDISDAELKALALDLGADVPMCLTGKTLRAEGIGEELSPIDLPKLSIVLVNPRVSVSTPAVYSALANKENSCRATLPATGSQNIWLSWLRDQRNDLQPPAVSLAPEIAICLDALEDQHADLVRMSGSGATCFGIFKGKEQAKRAASELSAAHPNWWVAPCTSV